MTRKQRRLIMIGASLGVLAIAAALVLSALRDSIVFFNSPTDVVEKHVAPGTRIRIGGLVKEGSVQRGDDLRIKFDVTDGRSDIAVRYQGIVPDLFREGQGVVAEGTLEPGGSLVADTVLAKHDERYMPKEVVDALKKAGRWQEGGDEMIPELGHYALVLALALGLIQSVVPIIGARKHDDALMRLASSTALMQFAFVALSFAALATCYVTSDFSVATVFENSHSMMPLVYKFSSVWGNHEGSMLLWVLILSVFGAGVAAFGGNLPATLKAHVLAVQSWIASAFYLFILLTSNPFLRLPQRAVRGPRSQSDFAGPRPRHSSAAALSRLCRLLHRLLLCHRRVDRGPHRRRLGALGAAVDAGRLDVPDARHRDGFVLGLLHARLGRLLVLGSGGECVAHAVARRHRAVAFRGGDGKA